MTDRAEGPGLGAGGWKRIAAITAAAALLFAVVRLLPTGTNLSHMDFRVSGPNVIEFCRMRNIRVMDDVELIALLARRREQ